MRFLTAGVCLAVALLLAGAGPAHAQKTYTGFSCGSKIPCSPLERGFPAPAQLASQVTSCVDGYMGPETANAIDVVSGMLADGCYAVSVDQIPEIGGSRTVPHCCLRTYGANACIIHCSITNE